MEDTTPHQPSLTTPATCSAEALQKLHGRAQAALAAQRDRMAHLERQLTGQLDAIAAAIADQLTSHSTETQRAEQALDESQRLRHEFEQAQANWQQEQDEINAAIANRQRELDQQNANQDQRSGQLDARDCALAEQEQAVAAARRAIDEARHEHAKREAAWIEATSALESARDELQQKFNLLLADVQRLRSRVAELEEELARRPAANQSDSAELVHLRAERDALAERVEELEGQPAPQLDADTQQHMADLQRRFELAVEDVRELKTVNAKLEARLAESEQHASPKSDGGAMDWESQKRRLLASLSEEGEPTDAARRKERATIEGAIRITDEVVAEKDAQIAELKQHLDPAHVPSDGSRAADAAHDPAVERMIDTDEIVQRHRHKLAQLEKEMEDKLRAAELELSVERAKLARDQAELGDWRAELESMQAARGTGPNGSTDGVPKRRWLAKLGLGNEDEGK